MTTTVKTAKSVAHTDHDSHADKTRFIIIGALGFSHFLNDMVQSLILALYPILKGTLHLSFTQIGFITLTFQVSSSLLQPLVGLYGDKHPKPYALAIGMGFTLVGLLVLSVASSFAMILIAAALVGSGSSIFHPESSRIARLASGGRHGLAQSLFQVGGNAGTAVGPLLAAWIVLPFGQSSIAWFSSAALLAIAVLWNVGTWYKLHRLANKGKPARVVKPFVALSSARVAGAISVLLALIFSKFFYIASLSSYYTFYLISKFQVSVQSAQIHLFIFLAASAAGVLLGGPLGDRYGRKFVIWLSILGVVPFTLALPYANLLWTTLLTVIIGLIIASAFSAILVYAQELIPGKVGMVSGLFYGFGFGMGGIGAAVLGKVADVHGIAFVYHLCSFLPLLGLLAVLLPNIEERRRVVAAKA